MTSSRVCAISTNGLSSGRVGIGHAAPAKQLCAVLEGKVRATIRLAARVASHLTDLVALALGATRDAVEVAQGRGLRAARLAAIKADIDALPASPGSRRNLRRALGRSPRYMQVLFEGEALTFSEYLVARGLARAYRC